MPMLQGEEKQLHLADEKTETLSNEEFTLVQNNEV